MGAGILYRRTLPFLIAWSGALTFSPAAPAAQGDWQISGYTAVEARYFPEDSLDPRQSGENLSAALRPEFYYESQDRRDLFSFVPFARVDENDSERTHFDIRELSWSRAGDAYEFRLGVRKVFWGVTESQHLVDIINQTDLVEDIDGESKLGQPMLNLALIRDWGTLDFFVLTGFRERTFPGPSGRPRLSPRVDPDKAVFESSAEEEHIDLALRWSHFVGPFDIGLSHFHGTSRDPRFGLDQSGPETVLFPIYDQIDQTGIDAQYTVSSWLWKLEAIYRQGQGSNFIAATGGFEYTFYGIFEKAWDLGLLVEYLWDDDRPVDALSPFEDDVFVGMRWTLNDAASTEALAGCIFDVDTSARFCNLEASRRFGDRLVLSLEARTFNQIPEQDLFFSLRNDDYVQLELAYYF